jgi:3-hydroxyacyl-CoA dehydrogenase
MEYIKTNLTAYTAITHRQPGTYSATDDLEAALKDIWLVFEAVPEKLSIKQSTFSDLERLAPKAALLCTNSSSFKSSEMVGQLSGETKKRLLNMHYMRPPQRRPY